jgi:hypothetical protein
MATSSPPTIAHPSILSSTESEEDFDAYMNSLPDTPSPVPPPQPPSQENQEYMALLDIPLPPFPPFRTPTVHVRPRIPGLNGRFERKELWLIALNNSMRNSDREFVRRMRARQGQPQLERSEEEVQEEDRLRKLVMLLYQDLLQ